MSAVSWRLVRRKVAFEAFASLLSFQRCDDDVTRLFCLFLEAGGAGDGALGLSHEPLDLVVARGQGARLDCAVRPATSGDARAPSAAFAVAWYHDGELLRLPDARRHLLANGSLHFDKVTREIRKLSNPAPIGVHVAALTQFGVECRHIETRPRAARVANVSLIPGSKE